MPFERRRLGLLLITSELRLDSFMTLWVRELFDEAQPEKKIIITRRMTNSLDIMRPFNNNKIKVLL